MATAVQRFYRFHSRFYDQTRWLVLHGRRRAIGYLAVQPCHAVLEVGCGTGQNFGYLVPRLTPGLGSLTGVDFSPDMLARAARRCAARGWRNVYLVCQDATRLGLGRLFDRVLFCYSLSMIPDWQAALRAAYDRLAVGGLLVVHDFGTFHRWGPFAPLARGWLRLHHVMVHRTWITYLGELFGSVAVTEGLGGYYMTVAARK